MEAAQSEQVITSKPLMYWCLYRLNQKHISTGRDRTEYSVLRNRFGLAIQGRETVTSVDVEYARELIHREPTTH